MDSISYTAARRNLAKAMDQACNDNAPVVIKRKEKASVVMMSLEEYREWKKLLIYCDQELMHLTCLNRYQNWKNVSYSSDIQIIHNFKSNSYSR